MYLQFLFNLREPREKRFILTHPAAVDPLTDQHTIDLWAAAYQWQKDKETIIIQDNVHENIFYVKAKQAKQLTDQDAENYKNLYNYINDNECDWNKGFEALARGRGRPVGSKNKAKK